MLYLAFRFQFSFGVGAVVATIHDLLITLAFLAFFRYDMTLNVIAAILTMTGFSTNDTIVIFDRVRENLRSMRRDSLNQVINVSVNQTLGRTIITSGTALLTALALFFFGGEVLHGLRVHDGRRHHHGHLFERLHCRGDRELLARHGPDARRRARARHWPSSPRSSPRADRSRNGKRAHRSCWRFGGRPHALTTFLVSRGPARLSAGAALVRGILRSGVPITMPATLQAALLGVVQGLTEFLPVSSSAHLILARMFFGFDADRFGLAFDVACHVGTLIAVVIFFRREVGQMIRSLPRVFSPGRRQRAGPREPQKGSARR